MKLKLLLDNFEDNKAILKTEDGDLIFWPKNKLPKNINKGEVLFFDINNEFDKESKEKNAKEILNEILDINNQ